MKISFGEAKKLATELLIDVGYSTQRAEIVARALALADAWELASHGLLRLPIYLDRSQAGGYVPSAELRCVTDLGALAVFDGGASLGHWQLSEGLELAIPKAKRFGISAIAIGDSGHCGALGVYAADAAELGMASLVVSCGPAVLPPWGGHERLLSTSPIAAGFPLDGAPAVIDLALSTVARGKIAAYASRDEKLPDNWALNSAGHPTNDPQEALSGMLAPLGGAKGFALSFLVESLTAGLVGPKISKDIPDFFDPETYQQHQGISHLLVVIDPSQSDVNGDPTAAASRFARLAVETEISGGRIPGARRLAPSQIGDDMLIEVEGSLLSELQDRSARNL